MTEAAALRNEDEGLECWFLTGSQALYGDATLRQVDEQSAALVKMLNEGSGVGVRVVWKPVLTSADAIRRACIDASASDNCVGVIAWMHTFSPAKAWIAGLDVLHKPLLHLHTQANVSLPWDSIDMDFMNLNQAAHGDREFGYLQTRMALPRKTVVGHVSDPLVRTRIDAWARAATGLHAVRTMRLARFGDNMRDVAVTDGDKVEAQVQLGVSVNSYAVNDLVAAVENATTTEIDETVGEYQDAYDIVPALEKGGDRHGSLRYAAALEVGLRSFLRSGGFTAFTSNFEDLGALRQLPGIAVQRLMAAGYGFGGEGDWKTAMLVRLLKVMAGDRAGGTSFMEDYTYHLGPGEPKILGAHMLEVCPSIAAHRPSCEIHPLGIGGREDPVRLVFDAAPGAGFVVGLIDLGDRFRLVANDIEIVPPDEPLRSLPVARAVWKPAPSLSTSAESWLMAGGPHHTALSTAVGTEALEDFAVMAGMELVRIDAATTTAAFARELRWNQAYYRLAPGLARH
ncbi:MAG TPA: L-arabinose isomerase [Acidothermaceae bacterium]|nr:L-arabinose isomerase [Acidothermaceae bacterium]